MKILLVHGYSEGYGVDARRLNDWLMRLRVAGISIDPYLMPLKVRGMRMPWHQLEYRWNKRDRELLTYYEDLAEKAADYDVLINFGGMNLHPDFLTSVKPITVFRFNDDPESSEYFSMPVASAHDICAIGNIAEVDTYRSWGVKNVCWTPHGFWQDDYDGSKTFEEVFLQKRTVDVVLLCERITQYRKRNVDRYSKAVPSGVYYGNGWPGGFLPESRRIPLLQNSKIGINIHNSTGPIIYRTFYLPANGVLEICDNKKYLGEIFALGKEVVGFDSIDEAIELTKYYLAHEDERLAIAKAGYQRTVSDYNEVAAFRRIVDAVVKFRARNELRRACGSSTAEIAVKRVESGKVQFVSAAGKCLVKELGFKLKNFFSHKLPRYIGVIMSRMGR